VEEGISVDIVEKDVSLLDPARVNVMDRARKIYPWSSWHTLKISNIKPSAMNGGQGYTPGARAKTERFLIPKQNDSLVTGQPVR
jgi:hypothetical protein